MTMPLYKKAFPDFGGLDVEIPKGFEDISWKNDVCPSFLNEEKGLRIWVDYADPKMREIRGRLRFAVQEFDVEQGEGADDLVQKDDWNEVLKFVDEYAPAAAAPKM